jgi:hypothetical protein
MGGSDLENARYNGREAHGGFKSLVRAGKMEVLRRPKIIKAVFWANIS